MLSKLLRAFCKHTFGWWENLGIHVTACHFYEPIPDTRQLNDKLWKEHSELLGIDTNDKYQMAFLELIEEKFKDEYDAFPETPTESGLEFYLHNSSYSAVDAEILWSMVRHFKPRRIIEIGAGLSTRLVGAAVVRNQQEAPSCLCDFRAIDPYPAGSLKKGLPGLKDLLEERVQDVGLKEFDMLADRDMLLIDSSHVLTIGSDVQYEYLEILPRLHSGVIVAFHDIFLPANYPKNWVLKDKRFWNEQYLLQAFLAFNDSYDILWMSSYMHLNYSQELQKAFKSYVPEGCWPGSLWIRKKI